MFGIGIVLTVMLSAFFTVLLLWCFAIGDRLVREWGGYTHTVIVVEEGFEYAGVRYPSLTQIAHADHRRPLVRPPLLSCQAAHVSTSRCSGAPR